MGSWGDSGEKKNRFKLGHMEYRMDPDEDRQELEGDRVDQVGDLAGDNVSGGRFLDSVRRLMLRVENQTLSPTWNNHPCDGRDGSNVVVCSICGWLKGCVGLSPEPLASADQLLGGWYVNL